MTNWRAFWSRVLSVETARFVLALMALNFCAGSVFMLMSGYAEIDPDKENLVSFALGSMFTLATMSFGRYFGRAGDEQATGRASDPIHYDAEAKGNAAPLPNPTFGGTNGPAT